MEIPLKIVVHRSRLAGGYWAEVPALPGGGSEAGTIEELETNIREAIEGWIDSGNDRPAESDEDDETAIQVMVL